MGAHTFDNGARQRLGGARRFVAWVSDVEHVREGHALRAPELGLLAGGFRQLRLGGSA